MTMTALGLKRKFQTFDAGESPVVYSKIKALCFRMPESTFFIFMYKNEKSTLFTL